MRLIMGVDVSLFAVGKISPKMLVDAEEFMVQRSRGGWGDNKPLLDVYEDRPDGTTIVAFNGGDRYYGPSYERGWWPSIYNDIVCLRAALPGCTVHYGSDSFSFDEIPPTTQEDLDRLWAHWLSSNGINYRGRI